MTKARLPLSPFLGAATLLLLGACVDQPGPAGPTKPATTASAPADAPRPGVFRSKRFGLDLELPGGSAWKIDDRTSRWLEARRPDESSTLLVRLWRDENRMSREKCEARARTLRSLPSREGAEIVEERTLSLPPEFDTHAEVGLVAAPGGELFGFILAFGGWGRRCFAYVFVTRAKGPTSGESIADRLASMMEGSLSTLTFRRDFDVVLERDAPPLEAPGR